LTNDIILKSTTFSFTLWGEINNMQPIFQLIA